MLENTLPQIIGQKDSIRLGRGRAGWLVAVKTRDGSIVGQRATSILSLNPMFKTNTADIMILTNSPFVVSRALDHKNTGRWQPNVYRGAGSSKQLTTAAFKLVLLPAYEFPSA